MTRVHACRSNSRNTSAFSSGVNAVLQPAGNELDTEPELTWRPAYTTLPHCCGAGTPTGVWNER